MTKHLSILIVCSLFFASCKREYAFVQPAKVDVFAQKQRIRVTQQEEVSKLTLSENKKNTSAEIAMIEVVSEVLPYAVEPELAQQQKPIFRGKKKQVQNNSEATFLRKIFPNKELKQTQKKPVKKKKKKTFKRLGTMIPTGFVFLGIAILLSLININGLALLFGVAAILFLFLGFKKLLRKKRRRDIFR